MEKNVFVKSFAYYFMAIFFYLSYFIPINDKKILLIMTHDDSCDGNVGSTYQYFKKQDPHLIFNKVTKKNYSFKMDKNLFKNLVYMFICLPYHIATSKTIFMDNVFLPFSAIKIKNETRLVQLWHGTGTIKKFGLDTEKGWIKKLAIKTNENTTHFIVGSNRMKEIYKTAFDAIEDRIFNIGCPRTDIFLNKQQVLERKHEFLNSYPELSVKKLLLYAPTFRDYEENRETMIHLDIDKLLSKIDDNYVLGLRFHPKLAGKVNIDKYSSGNHENRVIDLSQYPKLNTLLICSDILITDYSSIIFEYALTEKPMIFYSYDLMEFEKTGRGFYGDYKTIVPGLVVFKTEEIAENICNGNLYNYNSKGFVDTYLLNCDGNSRKRLYDLLMKN